MAALLTNTNDAIGEVNAFVQYFEEHIPNLISFGLKVIAAIVIFFVGRFLIRHILRLVSHSLTRANVDLGVRQFADSLLRVVLYVLLLILIATQFGFDATSVAAVITSCGIAIGLALQGSLSNFAGGILILALKPFVVGDYIIEQENSYEGTVQEIQLFYTKLTTVDNRTVVIPNGNLSNNSLINATGMKERQLDLKVNIAYSADIGKAKEVLQTILDEDTGILDDRPKNVFVSDLGDSAVVMGLRAWVPTSDYFPVRWRVLEKVKLGLDENGIEIPYPQVTVHQADK